VVLWIVCTSPLARRYTTSTNISCPLPQESENKDSDQQITDFLPRLYTNNCEFATSPRPGAGTDTGLQLSDITIKLTKVLRNCQSYRRLGRTWIGATQIEIKPATYTLSILIKMTKTTFNKLQAKFILDQYMRCTYNVHWVAFAWQLIPWKAISIKYYECVYVHMYTCLSDAVYKYFMRCIMLSSLVCLCHIHIFFTIS
jgi:hypothetical protein